MNRIIGGGDQRQVNVSQPCHRRRVVVGMAYGPWQHGRHHRQEQNGQSQDSAASRDSHRLTFSVLQLQFAGADTYSSISNVAAAT